MGPQTDERRSVWGLNDEAAFIFRCEFFVDATEFARFVRLNGAGGDRSQN